MSSIGSVELPALIRHTLATLNRRLHAGTLITAETTISPGNGRLLNGQRRSSQTQLREFCSNSYRDADTKLKIESNSRISHSNSASN